MTSVGPERTHLALFEHTQQLGLHRQAHLANLVEKERALVGELEEPRSRAIGAGEGSASVAEKSGLEQPFRNRSAVLADERVLAAGAVRVDGARDELFSAPRLSDEKDRDAGHRHPIDELQHVSDDGASPDDGVVSKTRARGILRASELAPDDVELRFAPRQLDRQRVLRPLGSACCPAQEDLIASIADRHRGERRDELHPRELLRTERPTAHAIVQVHDAQRLAARDERDREHTAQLQRVDARVQARHLAGGVDGDDRFAQLDRPPGERQRKK